MKNLNCDRKLVKILVILRKNIPKTLNIVKIMIGLTLNLVYVPNKCLKRCPYGTYVLLWSLECVLRERNVLLRSLKSLMSMYTNAI